MVQVILAATAALQCVHDQLFDDLLSVEKVLESSVRISARLSDWHADIHTSIGVDVC